MKTLLIVSIMILVLCSCANQHQPLVFASYTSLGIKASVSPESSTGSFQLGYHDGNLAIIPVATGTDENPVILGSEAIGKDEEGNDAIHKDAFSVIASFEGSTGGNPAAGGGIQLGKIVGTGSAAKVIADGLFHKLSK